MDTCRNCGSRDLRDLGSIGQIAPFFLKRVLNLECGIPPSPNPIKRLLRRAPLLGHLVEKVYGRSPLIEMQMCRACSFVQTRLPFPDEAIARLYADYRSDSYNRERVRYEPEYAQIAHAVGSCLQEVRSRTMGLERWLSGKLQPDQNFSMLDYGGADGRFLPNFEGRRYVFDISPVAPVDGVVKVEKEADLRSYSYVQLAHVLEHVSCPLELTAKAAGALSQGGYLYIEVPQELEDDALRRLAAGNTNIKIDIHEHINRYCRKSVMELLRAVRLSVVAVESEAVDFGWTEAIIIRALARRV